MVHAIILCNVILYFIIIIVFVAVVDPSPHLPLIRFLQTFYCCYFLFNPFVGLERRVRPLRGMNQRRSQYCIPITGDGRPSRR